MCQWWISLDLPIGCLGVGLGNTWYLAICTRPDGWSLHLNIKLLKSMKLPSTTELSICLLASLLTLLWCLLKRWFCSLCCCLQPQIAIYEPAPETKINHVLCLWCILSLHQPGGMSDGACSAAGPSCWQWHFCRGRVEFFWRNIVFLSCEGHVFGLLALILKKLLFPLENNGKNTNLRSKLVAWKGAQGTRNRFLTAF